MTNQVAKIEKQIRIQLSGEVMDNSKEHDKMIKHYQVIEDSDVSSLSPLVAQWLQAKADVRAKTGKASFTLNKVELRNRLYEIAGYTKGKDKDGKWTTPDIKIAKFEARVGRAVINGVLAFDQKDHGISFSKEGKLVSPENLLVPKVKNAEGVEYNNQCEALTEVTQKASKKLFERFYPETVTERAKKSPVGKIDNGSESIATVRAQLHGQLTGTPRALEETPVETLDDLGQIMYGMGKIMAQLQDELDRNPKNKELITIATEMNPYNKAGMWLQYKATVQKMVEDHNAQKVA